MTDETKMTCFVGLINSLTYVSGHTHKKRIAYDHMVIDTDNILCHEKKNIYPLSSILIHVDLFVNSVKLREIINNDFHTLHHWLKNITLLEK